MALVLVVFPVGLSFWSGASALLAILLIGVAGYAFAVCLLMASFWHRHRYGTWPIDIEGDPTMPERYPPSGEVATESAGLARRSPDDVGVGRYRFSHSIQRWLRKFSSNI